MTSNQIAYQNMMEKVRTDQAIEAETNRHNIALELYNSGVLADAVFKSQETARHNRVMEGLQGQMNAIEARRVELTHRINELNLAVSESRAAEEARHNLIQERLSALTEHHNYLIANRNVANTQTQIEYKHQEAILQLGETERHNQAMESLGIGNLVVDSAGTLLRAGTQFVASLG